MTTVEGVLERVTYVNEESAWSVVKLAVPGKRDLVTVEHFGLSTLEVIDGTVTAEAAARPSRKKGQKRSMSLIPVP